MRIHDLLSWSRLVTRRTNQPRRWRTLSASTTWLALVILGGSAAVAATFHEDSSSSAPQTAPVHEEGPVATPSNSPGPRVDQSGDEAPELAHTAGAVLPEAFGVNTAHDVVYPDGFRVPKVTFATSSSYRARVVRTSVPADASFDKLAHGAHVSTDGELTIGVKDRDVYFSVTVLKDTTLTRLIILGSPDAQVEDMPWTDDLVVAWAKDIAKSHQQQR